MSCFLFSLLSMRVLLASAASWFGYIAVLSLYFSAYQPITEQSIISYSNKLCVSLKDVDYSFMLRFYLGIKKGNA